VRQFFARKNGLIQAVGLKINNAQNCKAWLAQLPLSNAPVAQGALAAQLKLLNESEIAPAARLKVMEQLREPVLFVQGERAKRYSNQPVPLDLMAAAVWVDVIALWQAMLQGYETCSGVDALSRPLVHQRLIEYTGLVMEAHNRIYRLVPAVWWQLLHKAYEAVETAGLADARSLTPERRRGKLSPKRLPRDGSGPTTNLGERHEKISRAGSRRIDCMQRRRSRGR